LEKPSMAHVDAVYSLMEDCSGTKEVRLPGITVTREYDILYIEKSDLGWLPHR